ncbi:MYND finger domain-containing protein [Colletotrichum sojae]|uniref:MYND finger domain-containing protein n=1 Tax=Colletotrichum sojae TaxID=2175907 RepID=A0A8H6MR90_9PEZI|nr:MYND finger domain-containing protein [Colletotrichum sojae]
MAASESERQTLRDLFQGERDLDTACEIDSAFMSGELRLTELVHQSDMLAPPESKEYYKTDSYRDVLSNLVLQKQAKLNDGNTATKLLEKFRAKQHEPDGKYRVIIVVDCKPGYAPAYDDAGFRGPGKAQFLAALNNYQAGTPRNFEEPSCFNCGKDCQTSHRRDHKSLCKSGRVPMNV